MTKEEMIQEMARLMEMFYLEDVEFFHHMAFRFAEKKGLA